MTNAAAINRLSLDKIIAEIEVLRLTLEEREQTTNIKNAIAELQMAEDWLKDESES